MITYPVSFFGKSTSAPGIKSSWQTEASTFETSCAVPTSFEGTGEALSPEDFFLLSLQNCFIATFKVYAEYSKLNYRELSVNGELIVEKGSNDRPMMKTLHLKIQIKEVSDEKKARLLVNKTLENGFILQSVKTEIIPDISITSA